MANPAPPDSASIRGQFMLKYDCLDCRDEIPAEKEKSMTAFYIGARHDRRPWLLRNVAEPLIAAGHEVTSRWLSYNDNNDRLLDTTDLACNPSAGCAPAMISLEDINRASVVVIFTDKLSTTGGYHVELGYALGLRKTIVVVGPRLNVFHSLPQTTVHDSVAAFLQEWTVNLG